MAKKERQDAKQKHQEKRTKGRAAFDETKVEDTGEGPLYPPKGGSYIHN